MASLSRPVAAAPLLAGYVSVQMQNPQTTNDPFPQPIPATGGVVTVGVVEFATLPSGGGAPARTMLLAGEPGGRACWSMTC